MADSKTTLGAVLSAELYRQLKENDIIDDFDNETIGEIVSGLVSAVMSAHDDDCRPGCPARSSPSSENGADRVASYDKKVVELYLASLDDRDRRVVERHRMICSMAARLIGEGRQPPCRSPVEDRKREFIALVPPDVPS